jgi:hypothetical protein
MTEAVTAADSAIITAKAVTMTGKTKALLAVISLLLLFGGVYTVQHSSTTDTPKDPYINTIQKNSDAITTEVLKLVNTEGTEANLTYWGACDNALYNIRYQNTYAEQGYPTISSNHKDINVKYRAFLHEAAAVVLTCENGGKPDLSKMNTAKTALY